MLLGIQPFDRANNFGFHFRMRYLDGDLANTPVTLLTPKHGGGAVVTAQQRTAPTSHYTELYYAAEVRGQYWLSQRVSLVASIPLVNNYQAVDGIRHADVIAMGDPLIMGRYLLSSTKAGLDTNVRRHRLIVGAGAKLPLAQHDVSQYGEVLDHDLQPGTGTWDWLLSAEYQLRGRHWGFGVGSIGRINGTSADGVRFGHALSTTAEVFRIVRLHAVQWLPSVGTYTELSGKDHLDGQADDGTGGTVLYTHLSSRVWWHAFGLGLTWQHAVAQDKGAEMIPDRERFLASITYNII